MKMEININAVNTAIEKLLGKTVDQTSKSELALRLLKEHDSHIKDLHDVLVELFCVAPKHRMFLNTSPESLEKLREERWIRTWRYFAWYYILKTYSKIHLGTWGKLWKK
jgi:hypothetical protein